MIIDFHIHTFHSYDSLMRPEKILRYARAKGLDGIVVCDHNTIKGGLDVKNKNKDAGFTVIVGAEIATDAGDITGIFLTEEIISRNFNEVIEEIRQQSGKVILNHPFVHHELYKIDFSKIDYIEGYNSRVSKELNDKALELAKKYHIPVIAGSDAHVYSEIGNCRTVVDDIVTLKPGECSYQPSRQIYVTMSQYIKALKRKSLRTLLSATAIQLKYSARRIRRRI